MTETSFIVAARLELKNLEQRRGQLDQELIQNMVKRSALIALLAVYDKATPTTAVTSIRPIPRTLTSMLTRSAVRVRAISNRAKPIAIGAPEVRKMITRLANDGGEITIDQVRKEFKKIGITAYDWNIQQTFADMTKKGSLIRRGRGRYSAPSTEPVAIADEPERATS